MSHDEIYARVHAGPGRSVSVDAEKVWADTQALILDVERNLAEAIRRARGDWAGSAADSALHAMTPLGQWALDAANDAGITAYAVTRQGEQAQELRNAMPEPNKAQVDAEWDRAANDPLYLFHGLDDMQAVEQESQNRAARAVDLMNTYTNNSYDNRRHMDYWTLPPQVTVETVGPPPPAGGAAVGGMASGAGFDVGDGSAAAITAAGAPAAAAPPVAPVPPTAAGGPAGGAAGGAGAGVPAGPAGTVPGVVLPPPVGAGPGAGGGRQGRGSAGRGRPGPAGPGTRSWWRAPHPGRHGRRPERSRPGAAGATRDGQRDRQTAG